jgi:hypothetical protein
MDELDHKLRQSEARLAESNAKLARLVGRVEAHFDCLAEDPTHRELLRARAWLRHDPSLVATRAGDAVKGVPEGWPETVSDPDEHVAADVAARRDAYIERIVGQTEKKTPISASPSVERFRQLVGDTA